MSRFTLNRVGLWSLPFALAGLLVSGFVTGQEKPATKASAKTEKKEKATGRLPAYYAQVVTKEQRDKIYSVQIKFVDQIQKLRDQIEALEAQQKDEVEAVLTAEQREQIAKLVSDAKSKRAKKTEAEPEAGSM